MNQPYQGELAQLYDVAVPDWPGEIDFYRRLTEETSSDQRSLLEVACGTGRVTVQLASTGIQITGIDLSSEMLDHARTKSGHLANVQWVLADMRSFELGKRFGLAIVPAYSFQLLLNDNDQTACLRQIAKHLDVGARLILHLENHDPDWLESLPTNDFTAFEPSGETIHPTTGQNIRVSYAWSHAPVAQSVAVMIRYETIDEFGQIGTSTDRGPLQMHCTSPHRLEQLLAQSGFETDTIYGDFFGAPFAKNADEMIWIARKS